MDSTISGETVFKPKDEIFLTDLAVRHITLPGVAAIPEDVMFEALEHTNVQVRDIYSALDDYTRERPETSTEQAATFVLDVLYDRYRKALINAMASRGRLL